MHGVPHRHLYRLKVHLRGAMPTSGDHPNQPVYFLRNFLPGRCRPFFLWCQGVFDGSQLADLRVDFEQVVTQLAEAVKFFHLALRFPQSRRTSVSDLP